MNSNTWLNKPQKANEGQGSIRVAIYHVSGLNHESSHEIPAQDPPRISNLSGSFFEIFVWRNTCLPNRDRRRTKRPLCVVSTDSIHIPTQLLDIPRQAKWPDRKYCCILSSESSFKDRQWFTNDEPRGLVSSAPRICLQKNQSKPNTRNSREESIFPALKSLDKVERKYLK